jgi:hypothetical protein
MIRTLRITSIIAAILATVLLVLPAVYGVRSDPQIEEFLLTPGAVDKFAAARGQSAAAGRDESQVSPLVKQAADFARYLNPPPPPPPTPPPDVAAAAPEPAPSAPVSAKFDLVGTSYYASHPELSLALIDEPGKGIHWVRQGSSIAHLTIENVADGSITVRDGQRTSEMAVKVDERWRSLVKGAASEAKPTAPAGAGVSPIKSAAPPVLRSGPAGSGAAAKGELGKPPPSAVRGRPVPRNSTVADRGGPKGAPANVLPQQDAGAKIPAAQPAIPSSTAPAAVLRQQDAGGEPGGENAAADAPPHTPTEKELVDQRVMDDLIASKISPEEAMRLMQMAETLEQLEELRKQKSPDKTGGTSLPEPNTPASPDASRGGPPDSNQT